MKTGRWMMLAVAVLSSSGCGLIVGVPGSGKIQSETRSAEPFSAITIEGGASLNVHWGPQTQIQVTTDDNLLPLIETTVREGRLVIRPTEPLRPSTTILVDVTTSNLADLVANGSLSIKLDRHDHDRLRVELNGASDFWAEGSANELEIVASGASDVDTHELQARSVKFALSGAGGAEVFASQSLDASISGAGSLIYYGDPQTINDRLSGVGSIRAADGDEEKTPPPAEAEEALPERVELP